MTSSVITGLLLVSKKVSVVKKRISKNWQPSGYESIQTDGTPPHKAQLRRVGSSYGYFKHSIKSVHHCPEIQLPYRQRRCDDDYYGGEAL